MPDSWTEVIRKQGEESARKQDQLEQRLREQAPTEIEAMKGFDNVLLLTKYDHYRSNSGGFWPSENAIWKELVDAAKAEILQRMNTRGL